MANPKIQRVQRVKQKRVGVYLAAASLILEQVGTLSVITGADKNNAAETKTQIRTPHTQKINKFTINLAEISEINLTRMSLV